MKPMSQSFSGFGNQLLQKKAGIQLPLLSSNLVFENENDYIGDEYAWAPLLSDTSFFPLRGGLFRLSMLRVIDGFGQALEIIPAGTPGQPSLENNRIKTSAAMLPCKMGGKAYWVLPPRIIQPARLCFDWLSAADNSRVTDSDPGTSPLCGWLLYNKLNQAVMVFGSSGTELGELKVRAGKVLFMPPPAEDKKGDNTQEAGAAVKEEDITKANLAAIENATLRNMLSGIKDTAAYASLVLQLERTSQKIEIKQSRQQLTMSLPIGYPFAVVNARYSLELKGLEATTQNWDTTTYRGSMAAVPFKTCLGNAPNRQDGLAGYYLAGDYTALNLPFAGSRPIGAGNYLQENTETKLAVASPVMLTLIMDPRAAVTVKCGILPATTAYLPQQFLQQSLKAINIRFLAAPVISPTSQMKMPLMQHNDLEWTWIQKNGAKVTEQAPDANIKPYLSYEPLQAYEGWLKLRKKPE
jgi:hypothetical protein